MTTKTKKILTWISVALVLAGAIIACIVEVSPTTDKVVNTQNDTVVVDTTVVDTVVVESVEVVTDTVTE